VTFEPGNRIVVALDVPQRRDADTLVQRVGGAASWVKVGLQLFCSAGPSIVSDYARSNLRVMLDLKLHDIPTTVLRATEQVASLGAGLLTVHASGGGAMMQAAVDAARGAGGGTKILAVTVLTSMDENDLQSTGQIGPSMKLVLDRAKLAYNAGCDGVVASALEAALIRATLPKEFLIVTPGIRRMGSDHESATLAGDQKRIASPIQARRAGADLIVVGRPIRDAEDPAAACRAMAHELRSLGDGSGAFEPPD
jgi:orotidine-5'-phosphate decarboxylase